MRSLLTALILALGLPLLAFAQGPESLPTLGDRPPLPVSPVDWTHLDNLSIAPRSRLLRAASYPAQFDLRDYGQVTPVRNQNPYGLCWAFSTMASLESSHAVSNAEMIDLSERHLGYFTYVDVDNELVAFDPDGVNSIYDQGGTLDRAAAMLIRGTGAVAEADAPYSGIGTPPDAASPNARLLSRVYALPKGGTFGENVKYALTHYGGVAVPVVFDDSLYSWANSSYYSSVLYAANHAVLIVGWDDTFGADRFRTAPPGDGAWIVKNSWGTGQGDAGYHYVSYHDATLNYTYGNAYVFMGMAPDAYSIVHTHSPLWETRKAGYGYLNHMAGVFTADVSQQIGAVGFQVPDLNTGYTLEIYLDPVASPVDGTLVHSSTGTVDLPGYATIPVSPAVTVGAGRKFAVVLRVATNNTAMGISLEAPYSGRSSTKATSGPEESYMSSNGVDWEDLKYKTGYENSSVCLVAFGNPAPTDALPPSVLHLLLF